MSSYQASGRATRIRWTGSGFDPLGRDRRVRRDEADAVELFEEHRPEGVVIVIRMRNATAT